MPRVEPSKNPFPVEFAGQFDDQPIPHWTANFAASTTITVHSLPAVGRMLEISAVAVVGDK